MKLSIITVTFNSEKTLSDTFNSVLSQSYKNIEHIIVDGGSKDNTIKLIKQYSHPKKKTYYKKGYGIYKSINYGIKKSSGDFITILNSDDLYNSNETIQNVINKIKNNKKKKIFFGNVIYFKDFNYLNIKRYYSVSKFNPRSMRLGLMPAHPASFIHREIYKKYGMYDVSYKIASDFNFFLKILFFKKIPFKIINENIVRMRIGGISTKNISSYFKTSKEIYEIFKKNNMNANIFNVLIRIPLKLHQLLYFDKTNLNKKYQNFKIKFDVEAIKNNSIKLISNSNNIINKKKFILSGLNLAFLGYLGAKQVHLNKNLYHWADGVWAKHFINLKKKPGRDILKELKLPKSIDNITVVGNLNNKSKFYLMKKFNVNVYNIKLPYMPIEKLKKQKIKIKNNKNSLILITLPTPKQEQLAYKISRELKIFKIFCIGASLAIASGEEKAVPIILKNYEYLWRLRTDTLRRIIRLISTLYFYLKNKIFYNRYNQIRFLKID